MRKPYAPPRKPDGLDMLASAFELADDLATGDRTVHDVLEEALGTSDADATQPGTILAEGVDTTHAQGNPPKALHSVPAQPRDRK